MNFKQLIFRNIIRNPRIYLSYFLSSVFSVTIFFVAALLYYHPLLKGGDLDGNTRWTTVTVFVPTNTLLGITLLVIASLALLFLASMFRFFLKERQHNFNLYLILGMTTRDLKKMLAIENILVGSTSIVVGIVLGSVFSKFILLLGQNILSLDFVLAFYFPLNAIGLTMLVYGSLFLFISLSTLIKSKNQQQNMHLNTMVEQLTPPQLKAYQPVLGFILLILSYVGIYISRDIIQWSWLNEFNFLDNRFSLTLLLATALLFLVGIYLFFDQLLIYFILYLRKLPMLVKGSRLLSLSNLSYRLKANSSVYFLITVASILAYLTITSTLLLSNIELYGSGRENSLAYTYRAYNIQNQADLDYHQKNVTFMMQTIKEAGYQVRLGNLNDNVSIGLHSDQRIPNFYDENIQVLKSNSKIVGEQKLIYLIPLSEYNEMANFNGEQLIKLKSNRELVILTSLIGTPHRKFTGKIEYEGTNGSIVEKVVFRFSKGTYNAGGSLTNVTIVSDQLFEEISASLVAFSEKEKQVKSENQLKEQAKIDYPFQVIHFREWPESSTLDQKIRHYLKSQSEMKAAVSSEGEGEETTFFDYSSSFQTDLQKRQENGITLLVSLLIGSVFFIFSVCTIYFRLFGELEQDKRYHKTLYLIGIPVKQRKRLVTIEMCCTFFLPQIISIGNYVIFMWLFQEIFKLTASSVMLRVVGIFFTFQIIFFLLARKNYLQQIEYSIHQQKSH